MLSSNVQSSAKKKERLLLVLLHYFPLRGLYK